AERPQLQIINGSEETIRVQWLRPDGEKVESGTVAAGQTKRITTTIGHQFLISNSRPGGERTIAAEVPVQAYRYPSRSIHLADSGEVIPPAAELALPAHYTQYISARGFPIVASAAVSPYALREAAHLANQMLDHRPDIRAAMIRSGARMCIIAHNEF